MTTSSRRYRDLAYWLARSGQLQRTWVRFHVALAEVPVDRVMAEKQRAKMPPGGVSWPLWPVVLRG